MPNAIPDNITEDEPPANKEDNQLNNNDDSLRTQSITPAQKQAWNTENFKNSSAYSLISICVLDIIILIFIACFYKDARSTTNMGIDTLKTFALTAMGFLFGRTSNNNKN
ncbi:MULTISPECIES: hypothetical protein [Gardnerella]|uniref:Uncharacterized protein n=1 Tax=Gardnerella vaginalis TaxID=2702 RepID=A0AAP8IT68_GARVA|nr:hypothetical protein [Gardnerella sp. 30-4]PKZ59998.1 hypothetical protein CYJ61_00915 [Gardnerella vaginalis]